MIDLVDVLAWPAAFAILGLAFILIFRRGIKALLDRTWKVGRGGLETFDSPRLPVSGESHDSLQAFLESYDNPLLRHNESVIEEDLKQRGLTDPGDARKALLRSLAGTQILLHFERFQGLVWASQISALTYLNSKSDPVPANELRPFYNDASKSFPELYGNYGFEDWLAFLKTAMLLEERAEGVVISMIGREFLKWRVEAGRAGPFHG
ncbi:MAG: hypothetical protein ACREMD_15475 [Gemmatimonadota bacterium]